MKKALVLLLVFAMTLSLFVACGTDVTDESKAESKQTANSEAVSADESKTEESSEEVSVDLYENLRSFNLQGETYTFLVNDESNTRYQSLEIMENEENPEIINEAIVERNNIVEDLLNCVITEVRVADVLTAARQDIEGDAQYDIILPYMPDAATLASEGVLRDLYELDDILQLDMSCFDQKANSDLSINGRLYFTTGDFSLLAFDCCHAIIFNKTIVENNSAIEDPYTLLKENKWTYDALYRNAKLAASQNEGEDETYGFLVNENYTTTLFVGSGERLASKDANDLPKIACNTEKSANVCETIRQIVNDESATARIESISTEGKYTDVWSAATAAVGENRALFRSLALVDLKELADYEVSYGLLPTPKADEEQEDYYNIVSVVLCPAACISMGLSDERAENAAALLSAFTRASTDTVRLQYYENILRNRRFKDEDGEFALDIMFKNRVYELATIYLFGGLNTFVIECTNSASNIFTSHFAENEGTYQDKIDDIVDAFNS